MEVMDMPSLQIRDLPEPLHRKLKEEARKEHRSFAQQAVVTIARGLGMTEDHRERRRRLVRDIGQHPVSSRGGKMTDPVKRIREDRER
jgi:hypothetical protein